jgi:3-oxoacyl-[acyl-carrier protein] reductase
VVRVNGISSGVSNASSSWFAGRIAVVTGGGRGIGRAISMALAEAGAAVAVNYAKDAESAAETVEAIRSTGGVAEAFGADISNPAECASLTAAIVDSLGAPDLLVHNAGVASRGRGVADTPADELLRLVSTHALGPHALTRELLPSIRSRVAAVGRGDIVFISSVATDHMSAYGAPYNMGKAAMEALASTLAKEEAPNGIRVNIVKPGLTVSEMGNRLAKATAGVSEITELDRHYAFGRVTRPEDVAEAVLFVCRPGSTLTEQRISIDGGPRLTPGR